MRRLKGALKHFNFHTKMLMTFSILMIVIIIIMGAAFNGYAKSMLENTIKNEFMANSSIMSKQVSDLVTEMDYVAKRLVKDKDLSLKIKELVYKKSLTNILLSDSSIERSLLEVIRDSKEVYRGSIITIDGDSVSSRYTPRAKINLGDSASWLNTVEFLSLEDSYLIRAHEDYLSTYEKIPVFSLTRPMVVDGETVAFVEIQQRISSIEKIIEAIDTNADIIILDRNGEQIYSTFADVLPEDLAYYWNRMAYNDADVLTSTNPHTGVNELIAYDCTNEMCILMVQPKSELMYNINDIRNITIMLVVGIIIVCIAFIYIFSRRLTVPLRQLRQKIKNTDFKKLNADALIQLDTSGYSDIEAIDEAFNSMQEKVKEALDAEVEARTFQTKAQFDALQARINPHFLFNMLGIVVNISEEQGNYEVADICMKIANMLRYSTTASDTYTTIGEEIDHTLDFLSLMKTRFEHRLEYTVNVDDRLKDVELPKLIIQPLVENSIAHGYSNSSVEVMKIEVDVYAEKNSWNILISDNGAGFGREVLKNLNQTIEAFSRRDSKYEDMKNISIGGMGIISTFMRMKLLYKDELQFYLGANDQNGAVVRISGKIESKGVDHV